MNPEELKQRTKQFALRIIRLVQALPRNRVCDVLGGQVLRAGTSVGANYRAACRARSGPDFISKMKIVEEECDESAYWMELLVESAEMPAERLHDLLGEANELLSITVASIRTVRVRTVRAPSAQSSIVNRKS
jgi:four helix bundle protein